MKELYKNIKARRQELKMSQDKLAKLAGYTDRSTIAKIEAGGIDLSQSKIAAIATALRTTPAALVGSSWTEVPEGFQPLPPTDRIPRVGRIACGEPITAEENIEGYDDVPQVWHASFSLVCVGDSMLPKIQDGDIVAIRKQPVVEQGQIAAVRIDGEATLKHVYLYNDPPRMVLQPENPAYAPLVLVGQEINSVSIEGLAVGLCRSIR